MADDEDVVELGLVIRTLAMFEHAVGLARGAPDPHSPATAVVSREDMVAAHAIAVEVKRHIDRWRSRHDRVRWPVFTSDGTRQTVNSAASAAKQLESELRQILGATRPSAPTVRSLSGGWPTVWVGWVHAARQPLEVIADERPLAASDFAGSTETLLDTTNTLLEAVPVLGTVVLVFEAASGRQALTWRKLSVTERLVDVLSVVLPYVIGRAVGAMARTASKGVVITKRAIAVGLANSRFASALSNIAGAKAVFQLALGLRVLPRTDFLEFLTLLRATRLTAREYQRFVFYLTRIDYVWRSSSWLKIAKAQQKLIPGRWETLKLTKVQPNEPTALDALARLTRKPVVSLPKAMPELYQRAVKIKDLKEMSSAKFPDGLLEADLFDLWVSETDLVETVLTNISKKGLQANTVAVFLGGPKNSVTVEAVAGELHRIWANPRNMYIDRVIVYTSTVIKEYPRPTAYYALPGGIGFALTKLPLMEERITAAEEVDAEPDPQSTRK